MADVGESLRTRLLADANVAALVSSRMYPDELPQNTTIPAIAYRVISTTHVHTINGPKAGFRRSRITIECFASTRPVANDLANKARLAVVDWYGDASGVDVRAVEMDSGETYFTEQNTEGSHELRYVTTQDVALTFTEEV